MNYSNFIRNLTGSIINLSKSNIVRLLVLFFIISTIIGLLNKDERTIIQKQVQEQKEENQDLFKKKMKVSWEEFDRVSQLLSKKITRRGRVCFFQAAVSTKRITFLLIPQCSMILTKSGSLISMVSRLARIALRFVNISFLKILIIITWSVTIIAFLQKPQSSSMAAMPV